MPVLAGLDVQGISVGGLETCLEIPEWKLAFDIGRCPRSAVVRPTVLFTHAHMDHMGGVALHAATRSLWGLAPPVYAVPRENVEAFDELFEVWRRLDGADLAYELEAIGPGEELALQQGLVARPFRSHHVAPCQGYGIWRRKKKLKPEYVGLPGEEIKRLRLEEGVEVTATIESPEFAFTGDTRIEVVEREEVVRKARVLAMEVTFLDDRIPVADAREKGHIHLEEVAERADLFENEALLFTHFSSRYRPHEIRKALDAGLPASLRERVVPFLEGW